MAVVQFPDIFLGHYLSLVFQTRSKKIIHKN